MSRSSLIQWADRVIKAGFFALFIAVPLILTPINYELFEYNKMMLTYGLTVVIAAAWLVKSLALGKFKVARTPLDIPILLFLGSQILSTIFSIDPHVSWMGYYSRFNGGLWSIISYVVLYYAFVSNWTNWSNLTNLIKVTLVAAAVVAFYGALEHFGIDKNLWVQDVQSRVFSTLGQPNWLGAYLVALIPISMTMVVKTIESRRLKIAVEDRKSKIDTSNLNSILHLLQPSSIIYLLLSLLFFLVLLWTRSRSGLFGFVVADILFWLLLVWRALSKRVKIFFICTAIFLILETLLLYIPTSLASFIPTSILFIIILIKLTLAKIILLGIIATFILFLLGLYRQKLLVKWLLFNTSFLIIVFLNGTYIDQIDKYFSWNGWQKIISSIQHPNSRVRPPTSDLRRPTSGTLLEYGGTESSTIRKYVWQAAVTAWKSSTKTRLIGTGTETFAFAFFQYKPQAHNLTSEWDFLYNKAHNEYLNYLATTGALGLGTYLFLIAVFVIWFLKMLNAKWPMLNNKSSSNASFDIYHLAFSIALFAGWTSILVTNFFGFSVVIIQLFFFLFPAFTFVTIQQFNNLTMRELTLSAKLNNRFSYGLVCMIGLYLFFVLFKFWYADTLYAAGYRLDRAGNYAAAEPPLAQAANLNTDEPVYHDELSSALAGLAVELANAKEASQAAGLMKESLSESDRALTISPKNVNFWKTRTKIYYSFSGFLPAMNDQAITALLAAARLSPLDPKIYYNLAILYGRANNDNKAIELLRQTIDLKPDYRDAYYALYVFYNEVKKPDLAKKALEDYLTKVDPNDKDFLQRLGK